MAPAPSVAIWPPYTLPQGNLVATNCPSLKYAKVADLSNGGTVNVYPWLSTAKGGLGWLVKRLFDVIPSAVISSQQLIAVMADGSEVEVRLDAPKEPAGCIGVYALISYYE